MRKTHFSLLLLALSLAYLFIGYNRHLSHYDEGLITVGAMRVLAGEMPHRDFWSNYAPGQYYLVAALFRLVGPSLLAERLFATIVCALLLVLVYLLAERLGAGRWGLVAWLVGLAWMGTPIAAGNLGTSLLCGLGSCYCWLMYLQGGAGWLESCRWLVRRSHRPAASRSRRLHHPGPDHCGRHLPGAFPTGLEQPGTVLARLSAACGPRRGHLSDPGAAGHPQI